MVVITNFFFIESAAGSIVLNTNGRTSASTPNFIVHSTGNVGIATTTPNNILQVGDAGRLKIGSGTTDYTLIGTLDTDNNTTNTKIFINGNTCSYAGAPGFIQYFATGTGGHVSSIVASPCKTTGVLFQ